VDAAAEDTAQGLKADIETVSSLAKHLKCVIALTGAVDIVSDGDRTAWIENGHPRLSAVTGTGCMCTSLIGAFCGSTSDPFIAAVGGILCTGVAGELAAEETAARGTGSFHSALIDQISLMDGDTITEKARLHVS
jgi:hydroxyethylthiazole kinase